MPVVHRFDPPERFVAGTVGPPGQRTFFLQARSGSRVTSISLEKQQVAVLAERIDGLLDEILRDEGGAGLVPAVTPAAMEDSAPLEQPIDEEFRAGTMTLAWDPEAGRVVIEVFPIDESDVTGEALLEEDAPPPEEMFVVSLSPASARAFCKRAQAVVSAGRPPCQFCGGPMDPAGHLCPRANGFRRR